MLPSECTTIKPIKAILFDMDGTLLDIDAFCEKGIILAFGESLPAAAKLKLHQAGNRLPFELRMQMVGLSGDELFLMLIRYAQENWGMATEGGTFDLPPPPAAHDFWTAWESYFSGVCSELEACPGAAELVEHLAKLNIPLAIATMSTAATVAKQRLRNERIFQHFDVIVTNDDPAVREGKPAPDIYLEAARRLGVDPSSCLVIEDSISGATGGKAAGCIVIAVPDPTVDKSTFANIADVVIDDLWNFDGTAWGIDVNMKVLASSTGK